MNDYFLEIKLSLLFSTIVKSFRVIGERISERDGHLRIKCTLSNDDILEFSIFAEIIDNITVIDNYSFHWQRENGKLLYRWDNTPHHPEIRTHPHHLHIKEENNVKSSSPQELQNILNFIEQKITQ
jgi:hypothetical protein